MQVEFSRFRIEALHNRYTIDVPIRDNRLILVGENGTGKSTVANFIFLFLTKQWYRIPTQYNFKSIKAIVDSKVLEVTREELLHFKSPDKFLSRLLPNTRRRFQELLSNISTEELLFNKDNLGLIASTYDIQTRYLVEYLETIISEPSTLFDYNLQEITRILQTVATDTVLYLPTYRRIEQDLAAILSNWRASSELIMNLAKQLEQFRQRTRGSGYVEIGEFGMKDVENTIDLKMRELKDGLGAESSKLNSTYLRDVILGSYQVAKPTAISELDESTINDVFNRIDQAIIPKSEQQQLRIIINGIKTQHALDDKERVVVHFLTKLIDLHKQQQEKERNVREFVEVCNQYLSGKTFIYDNINFKLNVHLQRPASHQTNPDQSIKDENTEALDMSKLSSGEKQIVSLFSQIYLSGSSNYFVIIDEPELSLSVPWQKRFLPDILNTKRCSGLIAVTHSPYIFDNLLDEYTHSIERFTELVDVER